MDGQVALGTCGFSYDHWRNVFYPRGLAAGERLNFYAGRFNSVEIDSTFYRLPAPGTAARWRDETPPAFRFSVKGSRYITHYRRLMNAADALETFFAAVAGLGDKLSVVLWQIPPTTVQKPETVADFLKQVRTASPRGLKQAFEFRAGEDGDPRMLEVLREFGCVCVIADSDRAETEAGEAGGDFAYVRLHGRRADHYNYPPEQLEEWAKRLGDWGRRGIDSYIYFNNDTSGYAVQNARFLAGAYARETAGVSGRV